MTEAPTAKVIPLPRRRASTGSQGDAGFGAAQALQERAGARLGHQGRADASGGAAGAAEALRALEAEVTVVWCSMVGGCTGSTAGGIKIFRYELLWVAVTTEVRRLYRPDIVVRTRYQGTLVPEGVMDSVIAFVMLYLLSLGVVSVALVLVGLDTVTAVSGAATALGNVGPGLSPAIGPASTFAGLPDTALWLLSAAMMIGRLEIMVVFVLFTAAFWRA